MLQQYKAGGDSSPLTSSVSILILIGDEFDIRSCFPLKWLPVKASGSRSVPRWLRESLKADEHVC